MARVLIAERDGNVCRLLVTIITQLGHDATGWGSTIDAARGRPAVPPDVLLLDSDLPEALALADDLRARRPRLPIICMSFRGPAPQAR